MHQQPSQPPPPVRERWSLYSDECRLMLLQSAQWLDDANQKASSSVTQGGPTAVFRSRYADSSASEEEDGKEQGEEDFDDDDAMLSSASSGSEEEEENDETKNSSVVSALQDESAVAASSESTKQPAKGGGNNSNKASTPKTKPPKPPKFDKKQHEVDLRKNLETVACNVLPLPPGDEAGTAADLHLSSSLLSKAQRLSSLEEGAGGTTARTYARLAHQLSQAGGRIVVLFLRSGRFAAGIFAGNRCTHHRTAQRYTVRRGQGKMQSAQDSQRRAKSMGAQLRRAGEESLKEDIRDTLDQWQHEIAQAALILISCPKTMRKSLYDSMEHRIPRDDERIRRVPLDLNRPTYQSIILIHDVMTTVTVRERTPQQQLPEASEQSTGSSTVQDFKPTTAPATEVEEEEEVVIPLSALHVAAKNGDGDVLLDLLETGTDTVDTVAGPDYWTPLHYAAAAVDPSKAADCVLALLRVGKANPLLADARSRPPYFLAAHEKVRAAFRMARADLGEDFCDWEAAKVGPPLTEDDVRAKKEKEAEKKRKKKARQKEKKAKEKAQQEEMEEQLRLQEEQKKQEEEARRVRAGLQPQKKAPNVCDFCQKVCKGRQRSQMFKRLEFAYCTTDCVQKHKRELMAAAAMARFQN